MGYRHATYDDVKLAIAEKRIAVDGETGRVQHRRPYPKAIWRETKLEAVSPKGRDHLQPYYRVSFTTSKGRFRCLVHRLVWFACVGPIRKGLFINHLDGDKANNKLENLELVTQSENVQHAIKAGLYDPYSPKNWSLTKSQVREIRASVADGETQMAVARRMNTSTNTVSRIIRGKSYRSIID